MTRTRTDLALVAALVTVCLWASAFVGIRDAGHHISPGALSLGRLLVATLALGVLVALRGEALRRARTCRASRSSGCSGSAPTTSC